jgi:hypothetical protein
MQQTNNLPPLDPQRRDILSDTVLYKEACQFVQEYPPPSGKQLAGHLIGLSASGRRWEELIQFINNQRNRESLALAYKTFYDGLYKYLDNLRGRVQRDFKLLDNLSGLSKNQERELQRQYAQELAQLFIQHLVAEALVQKKMGDY